MLYGSLPRCHFFLQHPDVFTKVVATLPGIYDARFFNNNQDYGQDDVVYQTPQLEVTFGIQNDGWFIDRYRQTEVIVCTGLGDWEQDGLPASTTSNMPLKASKSLPGLTNGVVMSPMIGYGGGDKCLISLHK